VKPRQLHLRQQHELNTVVTCLMSRKGDSWSEERWSEERDTDLLLVEG
jgi:hypothetical protein